MKKINYLIGAAAILLASCANDDLVNPVDSGSYTGKGVPMSFAFKKANISRNDPAQPGLETVNYDFGVWAYKTKSNDGGVSASPTETVMPNYLVGFHGANGVGYTSTAYPQNEGTWFYAGLGSLDEATYSATNGSSASQSKHEHQYLKYWDDSYAYTYFYAYSPYDKEVTISTNANNKTVTIQFPNSTESWRYASAKATNANHENVPLNFKSVSSNINLAFYNTIPGYKVEIINYSTNENAKGVGFVPSKQTVSDKIASYSAHTINLSGIPTVVYTIKENGDITTNVSQSTSNTSDAGFKWENANGTLIPYSTDGSEYITLESKSIQPQNCGCGFTLNVSLKLTALDTGEVIYVRGARVHVPKDYFDWEDNHIYTYLFRITDNVPGTTGEFTETAFSHEPNPLHALYPIVFEDVTIENMSTQEIETILNALTINKTAATINMTESTTEVLQATVLSGITGATFNWTWTSNNESIATVEKDTNNGNTATVTGVAVGTATITCTLEVSNATETKYNGTYYANCAVTVTNN